MRLCLAVVVCLSVMGIISDPITPMVEQLQTNADDVERQLSDINGTLPEKNNVTEQKLVQMEAKLDSVLFQLSQMAQLQKTHADYVERQLSGINGNLNELNNVTEQRLVQMEAKLDRALLHMFPPPFSQEDCVVGVTRGKSRERFLLWNKYPALCDTETDDGGWVIIQRRTKGDVDFYKPWDDYKKGFGSPDTDYWLGLDNIHNITSEGYNLLRVDMEHQGRKYFALYSNFSVADEASKYNLTVGTYSGTAGDGLGSHRSTCFSTFDRDNDAYSGNCVTLRRGGWWYTQCYSSNLNGEWVPTLDRGMIWTALSPGSLSLSEMKMILDDKSLHDGRFVACLLLTIIAHSRGVLGGTIHSAATVTEFDHSLTNVTDSTRSLANVFNGSRTSTLRHKRKMVSSSYHGRASNQFARMLQQIKTNADDFERQLSEITRHLTELNNATEQKHVHMEEKLDRVLVQLSQIVQQLNSKTDDVEKQLPVTSGDLIELSAQRTQTSQETFSQKDCTRGAAKGKPRERFLLWGKYPVLCDTETDDGGWIIIQRRMKGDIDFYTPWEDYKKGFGTPATDYWLGLDNIHNLTSQGYTLLRIDMEYQERKYFGLYSNFSVADEASKYRLKVGNYSGTADDAFSYHNGMYFTTFDRDNDASSSNCANAWNGGWWYKQCQRSNLNGEWASKMRWDGIREAWRLVRFSEMKIRYV